MTPDHHRLRFHTWLVEHGLDADTADAILMTMAPFDWHELATRQDLERFATKTDLETVRNEMATKTELSDLRSEMRAGFTAIRDEMRADRAAFQAEMGTIRGEMGTIRDEMGTIRGEMGTIRDEMGTIRGEMGTLRVEMSTIRREGLLILLALVGFMLSVLGAAWFGS